MKCSYRVAVALGLVGVLTCGMAWSGGKLHLPKKDRVQHRTYFNDGKGYAWDINAGEGTVQSGRNNCYSGALRLHVNGNNFYSNNSQAWRDAKNKEIEAGPWKRGKVKVYRRVKVYSDKGLARWLDIFENTSSSKVTLNIKLQSHMNYGIGRVITNTDGKKFGKDKKDFAFVTTPRHNRNGTATMHIPFGLGSKVKPRVEARTNGNQIAYNFTLTIPPKKTVILAYFESQNTSSKELKKMMKAFDSESCFSDLDPEVRSMIVNFPLPTGRVLLNLLRHPQYDHVKLSEGNSMFGSVKNASIKMDTSFGEVTLQSERIIGMIATKNDPGHFLTLLTDGQILSGKITGQKLELEIPSVGVQMIPFEDVKTWAFKISPKKPKRMPYKGPYVSTLANDRLIFKNTGLEIMLQTLNGAVKIKGDDLLVLKLDNPSKAHKVMFLNGSTLGGLVENPEFDFELSLFDNQKISRSNITEIEFAAKPAPANKLAHLKLSNGDILYGRFSDPKLQITASYGPITFDSSSVRSIVHVPKEPKQVLATLWNNSVLRGEMGNKQLSFAIIPGPTLMLDPGQMVSFSQPNAAPPKTILKNVETLIKNLGSESYKIRTQAQEDLIKLGPNVLPILKKHLKTDDLEVRTRLNEIIEQIKPAAAVGAGDYDDIGWVKG